MAAPSFYWHDYETWGADPSKDRPAQFAGVRTDEDLNIIGEPLMVYCRPAADVLPHPEACLITGITPQHAMAEGLSERDFIARIHQQLAAPNTCGVGYNSIRFDDEVSRYTLYRNFYDPYAREWQNGNSRWDLIDVVRLCAAVRPEDIEWPKREDGSPSFKLETLSAANGLLHESAHDALSDVYATIDLAKLIKQRKPRLFDYALGLRRKAVVAELLDCRSHAPVLHISGRIAAKRHCGSLFMPLMPHPDNKNSVLVYDLSVDPEPLINLDAEQIAARIFAAAADLPEGVARIPVKEIHINRSPMVATAKLVDDAVAERLQLDRVVCDQHWQHLVAHVDSVAEKLRGVYGKRRFERRSDPDAMLYDGFISGGDKGLLNAVREASGEDLAAQQFSFRDRRLPELLFRYRARNFPASLSAEELAQWQEYCAQKHLAEMPDYAQAVQQRLEEETAPERKAILQALLDYHASLPSLA